MDDAEKKRKGGLGQRIPVEVRNEVVDHDGAKGVDNAIEYSNKGLESKPSSKSLLDVPTQSSGNLPTAGTSSKPQSAITFVKIDVSLDASCKESKVDHSHCKKTINRILSDTSNSSVRLEQMYNKMKNAETQKGTFEAELKLAKAEVDRLQTRNEELLRETREVGPLRDDCLEWKVKYINCSKFLLEKTRKNAVLQDKLNHSMDMMKDMLASSTEFSKKELLLKDKLEQCKNENRIMKKHWIEITRLIADISRQCSDELPHGIGQRVNKLPLDELLQIGRAKTGAVDDSDDEAVEEVHRLMNANVTNENARGKGRGRGRNGRGRSKSMGSVVDERMHDDLIARKLNKGDADLSLAAPSEPAAKSVMGKKMESVREQQERQKAGIKDKIAQLKKEHTATQGEPHVTPDEISSTHPPSPLLASHDLGELMICEDEEQHIDLGHFNSLESEVADMAHASNLDGDTGDAEREGTKAEYVWQGSMYDSVKRRRAPDRKETVLGSHQFASTPTKSNRRTQSTPSRRAAIDVTPLGRDRSRRQNKLPMEDHDEKKAMTEIPKSDVSINLTECETSSVRRKEADESITQADGRLDDIAALPMASSCTEINLPNAMQLDSHVSQRVMSSKEEERRKASQALFGDLSDSDEEDLMKEENEKDVMIGEVTTKKNEATADGGKNDGREGEEEITHAENEKMEEYDDSTNEKKDYKDKDVHEETTDDGKEDLCKDEEKSKEIEKIEVMETEEMSKKIDEPHVATMSDLYDSPCKSLHMPFDDLKNEKPVETSNLHKNSPLQIPSTSRASTPPVLIHSMELDTDIMSDNHHSDTPKKRGGRLLKTPMKINLNPLDKINTRTPMKANLKASVKIDMKHLEKAQPKLLMNAEPMSPGKIDLKQEKKMDAKTPKRVETKTPKKIDQVQKTANVDEELEDMDKHSEDQNNAMNMEDHFFAEPIVLRRSSRTRRPVDHYIPPPIPLKTPRKRRSDSAGGVPISVKKNSVERGRLTTKTREVEEVSDSESISCKTGSMVGKIRAATVKTPSKARSVSKTPAKSSRKTPAKSDLKTPSKSGRTAPIKPESSSKPSMRTSNSRTPSKKSMETAQHERRETTPLSNSPSAGVSSAVVDGVTASPKISSPVFVRPLKRAASIISQTTSDEIESPNKGIDISVWETGNIMESRLSSFVADACAKEDPIELILEKTSFVWRMREKDVATSFCNTLMAFPQSNTWNIVREVMNMNIIDREKMIPLVERNLFDILIIMQKREATRLASIFEYFFDNYINRLVPIMGSLSIAQVTRSVRCLFVALALSNRDDKMSKARKVFLLFMQKISSQAVCQSLTYLLIEPRTVSLAMAILSTTVDDYMNGGRLIAMHMNGNKDCEVLNWAGTNFADSQYKKIQQAAFKTHVTAKMMKEWWNLDMEMVEKASNEEGAVTVSAEGTIVLNDSYKDLVVRMPLLISHRFKIDGLDKIQLLDQLLTPAINIIDEATQIDRNPVPSLSEDKARIAALKINIAMTIIHSFYSHGMADGKETDDFRFHIEGWVDKTFAILHRPICNELAVASTSPSIKQIGLHLTIRAMKEWNEMVQPLAYADLTKSSPLKGAESPMKKKQRN